MRILVTGATGFLGSHLLPELLKEGYETVILKRSFSNPWRIKKYLSQIKSYDIDKINIERVFQDVKVDIIIHLATDYGRKNYNDITEMLEPNVELPSRLLDLGVKYGIRIFINTDTFTDSRYTLYSATKKAFLEIARFFTANYEIKFINMVLGYMYGEMDDNSKFVPFVIENILNDKEIDITGGEQKRDFIYVKDIVNAYIRVLKDFDSSKMNYIEFNIGTGNRLSLKEFVKIVEKISDKCARINYGARPYLKNEIFKIQSDINKIKRPLNWRPRVSLEEGLKRTIDWYRDNMQERLWKTKS